MKRICELSKRGFEIDEQDQAYYRKLEVPLPTLSSAERRRRRLAFRNESSLYRRLCDGTCKEIVSMYAASVIFKVYDNEYWWTDAWDAMHFGQDFDFSKPFFAQFHTLLKAVPKMARIQQGEQVNSRFTNCASNNKNCYLVFSSNGNEDCLYGKCVNRSKNLVDCFASNGCELGYEMLHCDNCYNGQYLRNCQNCSDSFYLENCIGCSSCFACVNLRNKSFCIFNKQYSKQQYLKIISGLKLGSSIEREKILNKFTNFRSKFALPEIYGQRNEEVSGNYIWNSKNCRDCYYVNDLEDCRYCNDANGLNDCYDVSFYGASGNNELLYECEGVGHNVSRVMFSKLIWGGCSDVLYSYECHACKDIFGCAGLKQTQYCIFNQQYSRADYFKLRDKIIEHMKETAEWGEFFPMEISPFCYNESVAAEFFPETKEKIQADGLSWKEAEQEACSHSGNLIDSIAEVNTDIISTKLFCAISGRAYRIEKAELEFYKKNQIPIPKLHYLERYEKRTSRATVSNVQHRTCYTCSKPILTVNQGDVDCLDCFIAALN